MSCKHGNWAPCELCDAESALEMRIEELELERDALLEQLESARANTRMIAACDPDTIRALLEERDALAATLAATEAARDGYRDDAHQLHAALVRMVAQYESEFDHEDTHRFRPEWLREALARTNAPQSGLFYEE